MRVFEFWYISSVQNDESLLVMIWNVIGVDSEVVKGWILTS